MDRFYEHENLFENAFHYAAIGMALVAPDGRFLKVNRSLCQLIGYEENELLNASFQEITHPDDLGLDLFLVQQVADREIPTYRLEKRYFHKKGNIIWVLLSVSGVHDESGRLKYFISQIKDISERKAAEEKLRTASARLTALVRNLQAAIIVEDEDGQVVLLNREFCELFGLPAEMEYSPEKANALSASAVIEKSRALFENPEEFRARLNEILQRREVVIAEELRCAGGRVLERDYIPIFTEDGYHGHLWEYRDITERKRTQQQLEQQAELLQEANEQLHRLATTDALTGLVNRRGLEECMDREWKRALRSGDSISLVMMDLDHFKSYNDAFGHLAGDEILRSVAAILKKESRDLDLLARYGGEEIAILLPHATYAQAEAVAERFRQSIAEASWPKRAVTASFGVACVKPEANKNAAAELAGLIDAADRALYEAKQQGRNRVCASRSS